MANDFSMDVQQLALKAAKDKEAFSELICRYMKTIQLMVVSMANSPDEVNDLSQEGLMGLFDAVKTYDPSKGALFATYANVCIKNKILTAIRKLPRATNEITDDIQDTDFGANPEFVVIDREREREIRALLLAELSENEWQVFEKYLQGEAYGQIASELNITVKVVDNAMQRVRRKLRSVLKTDSEG